MCIRDSVQGDLIQDYTVNEKETEYIFTLKDNVRWHDGEQLTADDVVFTYRALQHPDVRSPLRTSWRGVQIEKIDDVTVKFTLPSPLTSFLYNLRTGIVPEHILGEYTFEELRSTDFNSFQLVGTGPFELKNIEVVGNSFEERQERIVFSRFDDYHGGGVSLNGVVLRSYRTEELLVQDFKDQTIQSMVGVTAVSDELIQDDDVRVIASPLTSSVKLFLKTSSPLLEDVKVRRALLQATDTDAVRDALSFFSVKSDNPFLKSHFVYDEKYSQASFDIAAAQSLLDEAGWLQEAPDSVRTKDGASLKLRLVSQGSSEYAAVAQVVQRQWKEIGVDVELELLNEDDLQSQAIVRHDYDIFLYGVSLGYDPDVFAYWHSSQADPNAAARLNFSDYKNEVADVALEAGRTRSDTALRRVKLQDFKEEWKKDVPAIALYQPRMLMVVREPFAEFTEGEFETSVDRLWSITQLKIKNEQVVR